jgi:threonine/homoserine/homoserine lactone efflux protein
MELWVVVAAIFGAILAGAVSPGPSFVLVARTATAVSRADGLTAALGMGLGGVIFAGIALLGLHVVLTNVPWLHLGLKLFGAAYLLYLAFRLWRSADDPAAAADVSAGRHRDLLRSFGFGAATQLSNPKTAIWYASVFTTALSERSPAELAVIVLPMIFAIEAGWYSLVAVAFSSSGARLRYLRLKRWIDRLAGGVIALLGIKLLWDTR